MRKVWTTTYLQNDGIVKMFCGRKLEVWNTTYRFIFFSVYILLFDNLMHAYGEIMSVNLSNFSFAPM